MAEHVIGLRVAKFDRRFNRAGDKSTDWVEIYNLTGMDETGTIRASTWHRVKDLQPSGEYMARDNLSEERAMAIVARWADIEPKYQAWLNDQEMPESGVPLAAWPGLTATQADGLRAAGYRTVEEVAAMPDQIADKIPFPGVRGVRSSARLWLESRPAAEQAARISDLEEQLAMLRESRSVAAEDEALETGDVETDSTARPKRGRPARVVEAA